MWAICIEASEHVSSWRGELCGQQQVNLQTHEHKRANFWVYVCEFTSAHRLTLFCELRIPTQPWNGGSVILTFGCIFWWTSAKLVISHLDVNSSAFIPSLDVFCSVFFSSSSWFPTNLSLAFSSRSCNYSADFVWLVCIAPLAVHLDFLKIAWQGSSFSHHYGIVTVMICL